MKDKLTAAEELRPELSRPSDPHRNPVIPCNSCANDSIINRIQHCIAKQKLELTYDNIAQPGILYTLHIR